MTAHPNILFVGSIGLENEEAVFRALGDTVGARARRYPDGETDARGYWIKWLNSTFEGHPQFKLLGHDGRTKDAKDTVERQFYGFADGVDPAHIDIGRFGYAAHAIASYGTFRSLRDDGVIPAGTRFQVALPTSVAVLGGFIEIDARHAVEPAVDKALAGEVADLAAAMPADDLAIQWDVCYEVVGHDGGLPVHYDNIVEGSAKRIGRHLGAVPQAAEAGIHLCYGDTGHKHIVEPKDLATSVAFANAICAASPRPVNWIHIPVPGDRTDDAFYRPLTDLALGAETELYLGLIHHTDGIDGTKRRIEAAEKFVGEFGVAAECGFGRRDPATIPKLLRIHAEVADLT